VAPGPVLVAVCTNRRPAVTSAALEALAAQVPRERIVVVTSGLAAADVTAYRDQALAAVLEVTQPGLSVARNRALAEAPAGGVIAFVDDDALVGPGWWDALRRRWSEAGERVACIGGPIRPRWSAPPPAWISDPILPALTLLDLGPEARELDPSVTTVYGANISFAVDPLREAGGFDPAFGHSGRRIFFSEEDEAQRDLARAGYRILYAPDVAVEHVIPADRMTRRSFVRRRFAYGRALGARGGRARSAALRQLSTSAPGAVAALTRGDQKLFMERAVRAAENAGVAVSQVRSGRTA
jgi:GT2 family glycosyltransferase